MTLRVPTAKAASVGMRNLSSPAVVNKALETLKGRARVKRAMWSRRAQEYEQKINSGDLISIAEVVRDLHRKDEQREQSYSERQLYEAALGASDTGGCGGRCIGRTQRAAQDRRGAGAARRRLIQADQIRTAVRMASAAISETCCTAPSIRRRSDRQACVTPRISRA